VDGQALDRTRPLRVRSIARAELGSASIVKAATDQPHAVGEMRSGSGWSGMRVSRMARSVSQSWKHWKVSSGDGNAQGSRPGTVRVDN